VQQGRLDERKNTARENATMAENGSLVRDIIKGAIAGAAATWVMGRVTTYMYEHESKEARRREDRARGDKTAFASAAEKGADLAGADLNRQQIQKAGAALHWGLGIGAGAVYGAMRGRVLDPGWKSGMEFGSGFFVLVDEVANPVLGFTPGPGAFPWQTHVRGLTGHGVFGVTAEAVLRALDRVF
jgi:hypothetical protein